LKESSEAK